MAVSVGFMQSPLLLSVRLSLSWAHLAGLGGVLFDEKDTASDLVPEAQYGDHDWTSLGCNRSNRFRRSAFVSKRTGPIIVGRHINNSLWPTLLRSDTSASDGVYPSVSWLKLLRPLGLGLIGAAAVVTPLGLYDAIIPNKNLQNVAFAYLQDTSPLGYGTMQDQGIVWFNRRCSGALSGLEACPGSNNVFRNVTDSNGFVTDTELVGDTYDVTIPQAVKDLYDGGRAKFGKTMSSFWDIHSRQYTFASSPGANNNKAWPVDAFRQLESNVLVEQTFAVQGLVVDMINGGIGFRNHTVPTGLDQGAEWQEDLLWLEPESACVDTNLTLEFTLPDGQAFAPGTIQNVSLVDNGGFANLVQQYPKIVMDDNQSNPKLRDRAYKAAWLVNVFSALVMNVTRPSPNAFGYLNSELGKNFPLAPDSSQASPGRIYMDTTFSTLVSQDNVINAFNSTFTNKTITTGLYNNPFNIGSDNYSDIQTLCQGSGGADFANSSNIQVQCGLFFAAAVRKDGKDTLLTEPNSTWTQSVFTCASLNKVSIKTVAFKYNATLGTDLGALSIVNITAKAYASEADMPLWGIEQPQTPMGIADINQLWGLVSDDFDPATAAQSNVSLKRAPELYLPGFTDNVYLEPLFPGSGYVPASSVPRAILSSAYNLGASSGVAMDYTGSLNLAMFTRWQKLSQNITTVPNILHLIWTDYAANALQGVRGWTEGSTLTKRDGSSSGSTLVPVLVYNKRVQYKWMYAIPAFVALGVFILLVVSSIILSLVRQGPARVRYYLNQLSAGRLLAMQHYPGHCEKGAPTKEWIEKVGKQIVDISVNPNGMATPGLEQKPLMYATGGGSNASTVHLNGETGDSYSMTPLNGRSHQGYVKMGEAR